MKLKNPNLEYDCAAYGYDGSEDYFQWWYFDASFENNFHIMTMFMPWTLGRLEEDGNGPGPALTLTILGPDGLMERKRKYPSIREFSHVAGKMGGAFGEDIVRCENGKYFISQTHGDTGYELTYEPALPIWGPAPGAGGHVPWPALVMETGMPRRNIFFNYMSMIPRGKVTGKLKVKGKEVTVSGEGYHEQGRTNISMMRIFTRWDWLKFYAGEYTIVMPIGVSTRRSFNAQLRGALVYKGGELLADIFEAWPLRKVRVHILEEKTDSETGRKYPVLIGISIRSSEVQIQAKLKADRRLERFKFTDFKGRESQPQVWFQHLAGLEGRANVRGKEEVLKGRGIIETMLLGSL